MMERQAYFQWCVQVHHELDALRNQVAVHQQQHSETKRLQPLHAGLHQGLSVCWNAIEQFLQPEFKRARCRRCQGRLERVQAMLRQEPAHGIGWCDACASAPAETPAAATSTAPASLAAAAAESLDHESGTDQPVTRPRRRPAQSKSKVAKKRPRRTDADPSRASYATESSRAASRAASPPPVPVPSASMHESVPAAESLALVPVSLSIAAAAATAGALSMDATADPVADDGVSPKEEHRDPHRGDLELVTAQKQKRKRAPTGGGGRSTPRPTSSKRRKAPPRELAAYATDKKTIVLAELRSSAEQILARLPPVWVQASVDAEFKQTPEDGQTLAQTLSFVPGQPSVPFADAVQACQMYVQQSAFGRKMDLRARYACGRCARPFNAYVGGPSRFDSAAARRHVAQRNVDFTRFCTQFLHVTAKVVRAEIYFSLLCDQCPPLLTALMQSSPAHTHLFPWSSFVEYSAEAYQTWQCLLGQLQPRSLQPSDGLTAVVDAPKDDQEEEEQDDSESSDDGIGLGGLSWANTKSIESMDDGRVPWAFGEDIHRKPETHGLQQLIEAVAASAAATSSYVSSRSAERL